MSKYSYQTTNIGRISMEFNTEEEKKGNEEEQKINAVINESSWATHHNSESQVPTAPSFNDLLAEEKTKREEKKIKKKQQPVSQPERSYYANKPIRAQEAYNSDEPQNGELVYDPQTGEKKFIPYKTEEDYQYEDERMSYRGQRGGYDNRNSRGAYNKNYGNRNYGGRGYKPHSYAANQFYDSGENDEPEETGFPNYYGRNQNDRRGGGRQSAYQKYGGIDRRHEYSDRKPTERLSATAKYGDYSKPKPQNQESEDHEEEEFRPHRKNIPKFQFGTAQPQPEPISHQKDEKEKEQPQPEKPATEQPPVQPVVFAPKKLENEEEWQPE